jgi:hypothetical protein
MTRAVAFIFDQVKAMADRHAELHADQARLQADVGRLATELEQARRPWRRLLGSWNITYFRAVVDGCWFNLAFELAAPVAFRYC